MFKQRVKRISRCKKYLKIEWWVLESSIGGNSESKFNNN